MTFKQQGDIFWIIQYKKSIYLVIFRIIIIIIFVWKFFFDFFCREHINWLFDTGFWNEITKQLRLDRAPLPKDAIYQSLIYRRLENT